MCPEPGVGAPRIKRGCPAPTVGAPMLGAGCSYARGWVSPALGVGCPYARGVGARALTVGAPMLGGTCPAPGVGAPRTGAQDLFRHYSKFRQAGLVGKVFLYIHELKSRDSILYSHSKSQKTKKKLLTKFF